MIGKTLGHYRILEKIGQGGMGKVFLAEDSTLQRKVALKFLPAEMQQDTTARKRFLRKARSAAALDHPYICHINEVGEAEGQDYIAMEYVERQSLKDRLAVWATGGSPLPLPEVLQIGIEVTEALEAAQREGSRIRITAELIRSQDQTQLWADTYEREMAVVLALQNDVARQVARVLALKLLPAEEARLANSRIVNPDAYEAYLKGSQSWIKMTSGDLETAERYFELALQKAPNYAAAHAGLTWVWVCRNQMGLALPAEAVPKMKAAALKAISLDDTLAEGHYALAAVWTWHDWNLSGAGAEWKRGVELNPNYPEGLAMYSHFLMITGHRGEAMQLIERALKLDPFNAAIRGFYAIDLVFVRRYDDAIAEADDLLKMQPGNSPALSVSYSALAAKGKDKEALEAVKGYLSGYKIPDLDSNLDRAFSEAGFRGAMKRAGNILAKLERQYKVFPSDVAGMYIYSDDKGSAMDWLENAYNARDPNLPYICGPEFDPLRPDPRFQALLRRMNLPQ